MSKTKCIGIIAEDNSDFEATKSLIKRISNKNNISFKKSIGNGCGKIMRKACHYAIDLKKRGCDMLLLLHDLDRNDLNKLFQDLTSKLSNSPITKKLICIPIEEIEAWFLSDPEGIKNAFKLKRKPNIKGNPENIKSPKEKLGEFVYQCSKENIIYINTKHNQKLADTVSLELMRQKCSSYKQLHDFIESHQF